MTRAQRIGATVLVGVAVGLALGVRAAGPVIRYSYDAAGNLVEVARCEALCSGECVAVSSDPANCGSCGHVCGGTPNGAAACSAGQCAIACDEGFSACGGTCEDLGDDPSNCGACGNVCPSANGTASCSGGNCAIACNAGYTSCDGSCRNLAGDPNHCGACGHTCPADPNGAPVCVAGECSLSCAAEFRRCGNACVSLFAPDPGTCSNGAEFDAGLDVALH